MGRSSSMREIAALYQGEWRRLCDWHEDYGSVLWVSFKGDGDPWPYDPYFGTPNDDGWDTDAEYSHWVILPDPPAIGLSSEAW